MGNQHNLISLKALRWFSSQRGESTYEDLTIWEAVIWVLKNEDFSQELSEHYYQLICHEELDSYQHLEKLFLDGQIEFYHHDGTPYNHEVVTALSADELGTIFLNNSDAADALSFLNRQRYSVISCLHAPHFIFSILYTEIIRSASDQSSMMTVKDYLSGDEFNDVIHTAVFSVASMRKWKALIKENQMDSLESQLFSATKPVGKYNSDLEPALICVFAEILSSLLSSELRFKSGDINYSAVSEFLCLNIANNSDLPKPGTLAKKLKDYFRDEAPRMRKELYLDDRGHYTSILDTPLPVATRKAGPISPDNMKPPK